MCLLGSLYVFLAKMFRGKHDFLGQLTYSQLYHMQNKIKSDVKLPRYANFQTLEIEIVIPHHEFSRNFKSFSHAFHPLQGL